MFLILPYDRDGAESSIGVLSALKTILVLLDPGLEPFRGILRGMGANGPELEGVQWYFRPPEGEMARWLDEMEPSLVVCSIQSSREANFFRALGAPVLNVHGSYAVPDLPSIGISKTSLAQHLLQISMARGVDRLHWMDKSTRGIEVFGVLKVHDAFLQGNIGLELGFGSDSPGKMEQVEKHLLVFARDGDALSYMEMHPGIRDARLGLMGVGNDDLLCARCRPQLSSLMLDAESSGQKIVSLIDKMLAGMDTGLCPLELEVIGFCERGSTGWMRPRDSRIREAMTYFRNNMQLGHNVEELSRHSKMTYRTFHRLFWEETGMPPKNWIDREQFEKAKILLARDATPLNKIASLCGYSDDKALMRAFRRLARKPPSAFRSVDLKEG